MPQKKRPISRGDVEFRDASLVVIASEDRYSVKQYFGRFRTSRTSFLVLATDDCRSSPKSVTERIDKFKAEYASEANDEFWICIDLDHWAEPSHIANFHAVLSHCNARKYGVIICNPCFELWILLHFSDASLFDGIKCRDVEGQLKATMGGYNKGKCCTSFPFTVETVQDAARRAKKLGDQPGIPKSPQAPLYRILDRLIEKQLIEFT